ncbi:MAG: matrixin family metalloprotease [Chthoniobacterales bacterium]
MEIVNRFSSFPPFVRQLTLPAFLCIAAAAPQMADGYSLNGQSWPSNSNVVLQLSLGSPSLPLSDGNTSWNAAVAPVLDMWNRQISRIRLSGVMNSTAPVSSGDRVNSVAFSNSVFGQSFGRGTLAVAYYIWDQNDRLVEADVLFNKAQTFDSYRGNLKFGGTGGYAIADIRRVFLHELGHGIGLAHSDGDNVMAPIISNRDTLSNDDIAGGQALYGAPTVTPPSHLANISTRMKVGVNEEVLIGGFIVKGSQPKKMILRASGPSLAAGGVAGALSNPTLELYDGTGRMIDSNDDWQSGTQVPEIIATGVAPSNPLEAALVATLSPGNYTAIVRGSNGTEGVALVEGYELDATSTRLANLSTRGRIGTGDEVLIGGLIVRGAAEKKVLVRAVGPSLAGALTGALADPVLEMYNSSGTQIATNDNWGTSAQRDEIIASTVPPSHPLESALVASLAPGSYTAIVRGANGTTGVGLIEVYDLEP